MDSTINAMDATFNMADAIPRTTLNASSIYASCDNPVPSVPIKKIIIPNFNTFFKPYF